MRTKARQSRQFVVCIDNRGYPASLEVGKLYRVIPDEQSSRLGYIRVVDESGEDYGYSAERFILMHVPAPVAHALSNRSQRPSRRPAKSLQPAAVKARRN
jgi:hypothetical protein